MEKRITGIGVSPGIAIGKVYLFLKKDIVISKCPCKEVESEKAKLLEARNKTKEQLLKIRESTAKKVSEEKAAIFDAHITLLEDEDLLEEVNNIITDDKVCAEYALSQGIEIYTKMLSEVEDEYLRERAGDLLDISDRWIRNIQGEDIVDVSNLPKDSIVIARDLTPSDTANLDLDNTLAFVTEIGGRTSHTSIMARSLELPAVVGVGDSLSDIENDQIIIINGNTGSVIVNPTKESIDECLKLKEEFDKKRALLKEYAHKDAISKDGTKIRVYANIGSPADLGGVLKNGADGIGLYRTEFLFMENTDFPTEDEQFKAYKEVAVAMSGHTVTIRTMDIGGDKYLPYLEMPKEENPALGWRALRICLDKTSIIRTQFRALLRASAFGKIKVMLPMIVSIEELRKAKSIFNECKLELMKENIPFNEALELGMMIETPSVVFRAEAFARESDFFSIGTNDLTQYTLASDRGNEKIAAICDPYNPSVLIAIKMAIEGAHASGIIISMCGELAGDLLAVPLLFGLGLDVFSMSAISIPEVKKMIISLDKSECQMLAKRVLSLDTAEEVKAELLRFIEVHERGGTISY
ncbi:phosphoenolpyruvate--protein phosphotransferase [Brachyspira hyodysenteriae]|uniref:Phosphoenolpyruvate-protein phosphotransferase n=2 Tax=Brachyspira hyodysenteriae TaxID=159 RepID=A0A3B6VH78_BRAHW|nr:phosphoenolpyruvate--protein phosphotransferase [Brachyspira hyodysenteriae]ACN83888.1 Phosphoenolpyruvate-protein phosphotransferase [Brachyspira hyodysenteriae WA1]ANN63998.1 phosphoenolpyruvate--protein phosphotransferase [Brachyspira hyodysenteriae ATCC 27164]AUJ49615.1 phosphoenolpyruvate--protein phosphotransferase [Brachyspira hyodysenteriae]KLI18411.1 phosphoenolpyruvate-protein phosphotransferase [Brachyspira hyodysenteriae]KLI19122.1 phosphoenolpyruvate-protein phosphotransferase 